MAVALSEAEERLRYDTPFWAGGVQRDSTGAWRRPGPGQFQGCAKILNKRKEVVPAIANDCQLELDEALERQRAQGLPMRALVLKARKTGVSTWIALKFLQRITQILHQAGVIVAQDVGTAGEILGMAKLAYQCLPPGDELGFSVKPGLIGVGESKNGRQHMIFGERSRTLRNEGRGGSSVFEIDTAGSPSSGRGTTPSLLHLSEVAFWEAAQAQRKMLAMLEALPYELETICVLESTANGLNHFYRRWTSAREGTADPDSGEVYTPIFIPWWRDPDCARPFAQEQDRERFTQTIGDTEHYGELAEDEPMLIELYKVTPEQLQWRRMKIQEQPDKSVQTFNQENPHSDEVAFIGSGHTYFPSILVTKTIRATEEAPAAVIGTLRPADVLERRSREGTVLVPQAALWVPGQSMRPDDHMLRVWEHPRKAADAPVQRDGELTNDFERREGAYIVAADIALGKEDTFNKGDYHAVKVIDHHTRMEVATHHSRMSIDELPLWLLLIATYYNHARLAVEVNGPGIGVVSPLQKRLRYKRLYKRRRIDTRTEQTVDRAGWATDKATKPAMEANFMALLADPDEDLGEKAPSVSIRGGLRDVATARQMTTYVVDEKGNHGAQPGENDDLLMAMMIAQMVAGMMRPPKIGSKRQRHERFKPKDPMTGW